MTLDDDTPDRVAVFDHLIISKNNSLFLNWVNFFIRFFLISKYELFSWCYIWFLFKVNRGYLNGVVFTIQNDCQCVLKDKSVEGE